MDQNGLGGQKLMMMMDTVTLNWTYNEKCNFLFVYITYFYKNKNTAEDPKKRK